MQKHLITSDPTTSAYSYTDECVDETNLVPIVNRGTNSFAYGDRFDVSLATDNNISDGELTGLLF